MKDEPLEQQLNLSARLAAGLLQHYGLPTHFFDVSPDLDVAVQFATNLAVGDCGSIAVLPLEALRNREDFMLADLTRHPWAERPRRQAAYAFMDLIYPDLKDPTAIAARGLSWYWFRFTAEDEDAHRLDPYLLDALSDSVAGPIGLFINDCAKFDDAAARWIADRVPAAAMVMRVTGQSESSVTSVLIPAELAGEQPVRNDADSNYRRWSSSVSEPAQGAEVPQTADTGIPPIGANAWVLRSDLLQPLRSGDRPSS